MVINRPFSHRRSLPAILNYSSHKAYTSGVEGTLTDCLYGANCLWDPDITGTGHQPRGYDTYTTMYNKYYVKRCTATVNVMISDLSAGFIDAVSIFFNLDSTPTGPLPSVADLQELARINGGVFDILGTGDGYNAIKKYTLSCTPSLLTRKGFSDSNMSGFTTANPMDKVVLHVITYNSKGASHNMRFLTELLYDAVFYDPIDPVYSS